MPPYRNFAQDPMKIHRVDSFTHLLKKHLERSCVWALIIWNLAVALMVVGPVSSRFGKSNKYAKLTGSLNLGISIGLIVLTLLGAKTYIAMFSAIPFVIAGLIAIHNSALLGGTFPLFETVSFAQQGMRLSACCRMSTDATPLTLTAPVRMDKQKKE